MCWCALQTQVEDVEGRATGGRGQEQKLQEERGKRKVDGGMVGLMLLPCVTFSVLKFHVGKVYLYLAGNNVANACV